MIEWGGQPYISLLKLEIHETCFYIFCVRVHFLTVKAGSIESIDFLLNECKVDINFEAADQSRPLHFAAREGHCDAVRHLLLLGADPTLVDSHRRTGIVLFYTLNFPSIVFYIDFIKIAAADLARGFNRISCLEILEKKKKLNIFVHYT